MPCHLCKKLSYIPKKICALPQLIYYILYAFMFQNVIAYLKYYFLLIASSKPNNHECMTYHL